MNINIYTYAVQESELLFSLLFSIKCEILKTPAAIVASLEVL